MKQKLFGAASAVAFILFGASCSNQEQSEFSMDSVKLEVTVSAKVTYDAGVEVDASNPNGYKIVNAKPAVGRKVFIEIPYKEYSTPTAVGKKIFETVTDENGVFTITVPTKSTGVNADIRLEEFTAMYQEYVKMGDDGKPVFKSKLYSYDTPAAGLTNLSLKPGAFKFPDNNDISYVKHALDMQEFDESVTIAGSINLAYETGFRKGAFKSANNANVEFEIAYTGITNPLTFGTTTDANGNYKIVLPMRTLSQGFTINSIKVLGIGDNQFKHWVSDTVAQPEIIKGAYELAGITAGAPIAFANVIDGITYDLGAKNLIFTPYYNAGITNMPQPDNWSSDLIGWAAGRGDLGFDESFSKTATLTGKIYMPYLKSFGEGAYKNERQTIILTSATVPYNKGLTVITEPDGSFSVDLPVKDENPINFSVKLEKQDQPFTFIGSAKTVELYDGKYGPAATNIVNIKEEGTEWYELGDYYFKYVPAATNTPDEWNKDLIGWYKDPVYNKINPDRVVKGKFLYAVEQSYGIGKYEPKPYIVTITIDDDDNPATANRSIAVKPDAQGNISVDIPLKDVLDQPTISVANASFTSKEYVHYTTYGQDETTLISDKYTLYSKVYENKDPKWNEKIGTQYYKFAVATDAAKLPSTFHKDLVGWLIQKDGNDIMFANSIKAQGQAFKAVETSFLKGEYEAAKGEIVKITISYATPVNVQVLTDKQGNFQFNVPIKNVGDEPNLAAAASDIEIDNFTHYIDATDKKKILSGSYKPATIKGSDAQWNDLGKIYYQFTPNDADKNELWDKWDNYSKYIAGWVIKKDYNEKATVHGAVLLAKESAFWTGYYAEGKGFPVKIAVDYDKDGIMDEDSGDRYYVLPTIMTGENAGEYNLDILLKYSDDDPDVAWVQDKMDIQKLGLTFEHFRNPGSDATEKLTGNYEYKDCVGATSAFTEQGTRYYKFVNKGAAKNWENNLNGWYVWPADKKTTVTLTGAIRLAGEKIEGSAIIPCWNEAKYAKATVTFDGYTFRVCTGANGKFNVTIKRSDAVVDLPATLPLKINPDDIEETEFKHWKDNSDKNSLMNATGTFKSAGNVNPFDVAKVGSTAAYDLTKAIPFSAKMDFIFDAPEPLGYDSYGWSSIYDNEK